MKLINVIDELNVTNVILYNGQSKLGMFSKSNIPNKYLNKCIAKFNVCNLNYGHIEIYLR